MKKFVYDSNYSLAVESNVKVSMESVAKFLVPAGWVAFVNTRSSEFGGMRNYFNELIRRYRFLLATDQFAPDGKGKVKDHYQEAGLNLRKIAFRPMEEDWQEFKIIKQLKNMSMCLLFMYLVKLDFANFPEEDEFFRKNDEVSTKDTILIIELTQKYVSTIKTWIREMKFGKVISFGPS